MAQNSRSEQGSKPAASGRQAGGENEAATSASKFWIHMASFAAYNVLVGYLLLHRGTTTGRGLVFFTIAMALHFVVTDFGLNGDHQRRYRRTGRWILVVAILAGWALGSMATAPGVLIGVLTAFLGGGVILNVLKEEVPSERQSRFWAFAGGATGYSALLLTL